MTGLRVEVVRPGELGPQDVDTWRAVQASETGLGSPFLSPAFAQSLASVRTEVRVAVLSEDGRTIGFLAFERGRGGQGRALGLGLSDVQAVVAPGATDLDLALVMRACGLRLWTFDHLVAAQEKWLTSHPSRLSVASSPVIDLREGFEAYLVERGSASRSLFQSTARKRRKLEREHGPVWVEYHARDHGVLEQLMAWKSAQYRRTGRRDRFADPLNRRLLHDLLEVSEPGFEAPLTVLRAGDSVVAVHLGLRSAGTLAWWFPVYDPTYAAYSPGLVLCLDLARTVSEQHASAVLDLGKGDEPYKDRLSNARLPLLSGSVARSRSRQALHTVLTWPPQQATSVVLASPRLRALSREALARAGRLREQVAHRG